MRRRRDRRYYNKFGIQRLPVDTGCLSRRTWLARGRLRRAMCPGGSSGKVLLWREPLQHALASAQARPSNAPWLTNSCRRRAFCHSAETDAGLRRLCDETVAAPPCHPQQRAFVAVRFHENAAIGYQLKELVIEDNLTCICAACRTRHLEAKTGRPLLFGAPGELKNPAQARDAGVCLAKRPVQTHPLPSAVRAQLLR
jgi:hypothetical protein